MQVLFSPNILHRAASLQLIKDHKPCQWEMIKQLDLGEDKMIKSLVDLRLRDQNVKISY
jgi:hypothetical protein